MSYTVDISENEMKEFKEKLDAIRFPEHKSNLEYHRAVDNFFSKFKKRKNSDAVKEATAKATAKRTAEAKEKIQNAINLLRMENKKITHYSIAKIAGVSYVTVKKYLPDVESFVDRQLRTGAMQQ